MSKHDNLGADRKPSAKADPKLCGRCGTPTRHRCRGCGKIECALCLNMADRCVDCAGVQA